MIPQLLNVSLLPLVGIALASFVAGGIFGPKLFAKLGLPGLAIGVQLVESIETKLKGLAAELAAKQKAGTTLGLSKEQLDELLQKAIAEKFPSK